MSRATTNEQIKIEILMHKLSIQPAAALCAPLVHFRPTTYLPHIREIPTNMHPASPESAFCVTFQNVVEQVAHRAWHWDAQAPS